MHTIAAWGSIVTLGDGRKEIGEWAFNNCRFLEHISGFGYSSRLTTVTIGDGLEEIGAFAFNNCDMLEHTVILNSKLVV